MSKNEPLSITPGKAMLKEEHYRDPATDEYGYYGRIEVGNNRVCVFDEDCDEHIPALYADSHNTYNKTQLLPSEMAEQLAELMKFNKRLLAYWDDGNFSRHPFQDELRELLTTPNTTDHDKQN